MADVLPPPPRPTTSCREPAAAATTAVAAALALLAPTTKEEEEEAIRTAAAPAAAAATTEPVGSSDGSEPPQSPRTTATRASSVLSLPSHPTFPDSASSTAPSFHSSSPSLQCPPSVKYLPAASSLPSSHSRNGSTRHPRSLLKPPSVHRATAAIRSLSVSDTLDRETSTAISISNTSAAMVVSAKREEPNGDKVIAAMEDSAVDLSSAAEDRPDTPSAPARPALGAPSSSAPRPKVAQGISSLPVRNDWRERIRTHSSRGAPARGGPNLGLFSGGGTHDRQLYGDNGGENMDDDMYNRDGDDDQDDFDNDSTDDSQTSSSVISWISWFCSLPGHEFFLEVPEDFIEDDFNLTGLNTLVLLYSDALDVILDLEPKQRPTDAQMSLIESSAEMLYGLIHQRFLVTKQGLAIMAERLRAREFGTCPREGCGGAGTLPCGRSDQAGVDTVKMFCIRCCDLYHPREAKFQNIDGAFFGTTFPHLLFLTFPECNYPIKSTTRRRHRAATESKTVAGEQEHESDEEDANDDDQELSDYHVYVLRIFGFRVSEKSITGPRMAWLRWREGLPLPGSTRTRDEGAMAEDGDLFEGAGEEPAEGAEEDD